MNYSGYILKKMNWAPAWFLRHLALHKWHSIDPHVHTHWRFPRIVCAVLEQLSTHHMDAARQRILLYKQQLNTLSTDRPALLLTLYLPYLLTLNLQIL